MNELETLLPQLDEQGNPITIIQSDDDVTGIPVDVANTAS